MDNNRFWSYAHDHAHDNRNMILWTGHNHGNRKMISMIMITWSCPLGGFGRERPKGKSLPRQRGACTAKKNSTMYCLLDIKRTLYSYILIPHGAVRFIGLYVLVAMNLLFMFRTISCSRKSLSNLVLFFVTIKLPLEFILSTKLREVRAQSWHGESLHINGKYPN